MKYFYVITMVTNAIPDTKLGGNIHLLRRSVQELQGYHITGKNSNKQLNTSKMYLSNLYHASTQTVM